MHALPLDHVIEVGLYVFVWFAWHLKSKRILGFLDHHASKCAIGGPRIKEHPPLSQKHDKGCVGAHICLEFHAIHCLSFVAVKTVFCRKFLPTGNIQCRPAIYSVPIALSPADGYCTRPVAIPPSRWCSAMLIEGSLGLWQVFRKEKTVKTEAVVLWQRVSGRYGSSMHHSRIPRRGPWPPSLCI